MVQTAAYGALLSAIGRNVLSLFLVAAVRLERKDVLQINSAGLLGPMDCQMPPIENSDLVDCTTAPMTSNTEHHRLGNLEYCIS